MRFLSRSQVLIASLTEPTRATPLAVIRTMAGPVPLVLGLVLGAAGCDSLLKNNELPVDVTDPAITKTPEGALKAYNGTLELFTLAYGSPGGFVQMTGLFSDELHVLPSGSVGTVPEVEARALTETSDIPSYADLQRVRGQAGQAIGLLTDYRPGDSALVGHVYALEGYAEVFLAEFFCSGIPLSTLDYHGEYTLQPGSSTDSVFSHSVALFDSALALAADNSAFLNLAAVGKGRALLALGRYDEAAAAVSAVPDPYIDTLSYTAVSFVKGSGPGAAPSQWAKNFADSTDHWNSVADLKGINGLDYRTSGDPRTSARRIPLTSSSLASDSIWYPTKYTDDGANPLVLASGVEARLIEAEAALQGGNVTIWLEKLNHLRQMAPSVNPAWSVLPDTTDPDPSAAPGPTRSRVDLLFRERAFWLFLTGHRQGDLRRLIRQYGRTPSQVYPVGLTGGTTFPVYGAEVNAPIPSQERVLNPRFTGCTSGA